MIRAEVRISIPCHCEAIHGIISADIYCPNGYKWLCHRLRSSHVTVNVAMHVCVCAGLDGVGGMERKLGRAWYL